MCEVLLELRGIIDRSEDIEDVTRIFGPSSLRSSLLGSHEIKEEMEEEGVGRKRKLVWEMKRRCREERRRVLFKEPSAIWSSLSVSKMVPVRNGRPVDRTVDVLKSMFWTF